MEVKTGAEPAWPRHPVPCLTFDFSRKKKLPEKQQLQANLCQAAPGTGCALLSHPIPSWPEPLYPLLALLLHPSLQGFAPGRGTSNARALQHQHGDMSSSTGMLMSHPHSCQADVGSSAQQSPKDMAKGRGTGCVRPEPEQAASIPWVIPRTRRSLLFPNLGGLRGKIKSNE